MHHVIREQYGMIKPGQDIVVAGYVGLEGTRKIVTAKKQELLAWYTPEYLDEIEEDLWQELNHNLEHWEKYGVTECEPVREGGVLTALWNLSGAYKLGLKFTLRHIPVRQYTIEICERYGINPYRLFSGRCMLLAADQGYHLVQTLEQEGIHAVVIGSVEAGTQKIVVHEEGISYLERPAADELYQIISK